MPAPTDPAHFDRLYATQADPWNFATSPYEAAKYAATLAALPPRRLQSTFEIGCSIGILSRELALRSNAFLGLDVAEAAIAAARARCADLPHARFHRGTVPADWPGGSFDLLVFSEVLYYLGDDLAPTATQAAASLTQGGTALLVNWLGPTGTPTTGDAAADAFIAASNLTITTQTRTTEYRLDLLNH